jgi:hypothetical protein
VAEQLNQRLWRRLLRKKVPYRFYPQCVNCSNIQGGILSKAWNELRKSPINLAGAGGGQQAHFHGLRPRINHLAGGIVAATTVLDSSDSEIQNGNRKRYERLQEQVEDVVLSAISRIEQLIN